MRRIDPEPTASAGGLRAQLPQNPIEHGGERLALGD